MLTLRSDQRRSGESSDGSPLRPKRTAIDTRYLVQIHRCECPHGLSLEVILGMVGLKEVGVSWGGYGHQIGYLRLRKERPF